MLGRRFGNKRYGNMGICTRILTACFAGLMLRGTAHDLFEGGAKDVCQKEYLYAFRCFCNGRYFGGKCFGVWDG